MSNSKKHYLSLKISVTNIFMELKEIFIKTEFLSMPLIFGNVSEYSRLTINWGCELTWPVNISVSVSKANCFNDIDLLV